LDYCCGYITKVGDVAIVFSIIADAFAAIPTVIKSYHHPESESYLAYLCASIGSFITILTINTWNFATVGFPMYIFIICTVLFFLIKFRPQKILQK
jgi:hypothetical protein